jgi:hypothetical protein
MAAAARWRSGTRFIQSIAPTPWPAASEPSSSSTKTVSHPAQPCRAAKAAMPRSSRTFARARSRTRIRWGAHVSSMRASSIACPPGAAFYTARGMHRGRTGRTSSRSGCARRRQGSSPARSRNASAQRSAGTDCASSPRPTPGEDRCASTRTPSCTRPCCAPASTWFTSFRQGEARGSTSCRAR